MKTCLAVALSFFWISSVALGADTSAREWVSEESPTVVVGDARIAELEQIVHAMGLRINELQQRLYDSDHRFANLESGSIGQPWSAAFPLFSLCNDQTMCYGQPTTPWTQFVAGIHPPLRSVPSSGLCVQIEEGHFLCPVAQTENE